ncbi:hypothetical protein [Qipengyuania zhejiangensis]|uniref:hypothetical protein n=1 Tax=Qipengyuania zhejiangensis TaxID=3077782 RepID=UPI002D788653|nr:hypothetical protein [Qipengyuania sp. Z2]
MSILDGSAAPGTLRAPFRYFAGSRIIERQVDLALAAGCEKIACLVDGVGREVVAAQERAESAGARFIALQEARPLSGLVSASDELLVIGAGVLPSDDIVLRHAARPSVLVFPAADAVPKGFERIDPEFAWSGVMLAHGAIVERLSELPPDADVISCLLRIALQSGVRIQPLEKRLLDEGLWHFNPTEAELADRAEHWIHSHAAAAAFTAPGLAVSERIGTKLAKDLLGGRGARIPAIAAGLAGVVALTLGILEFPVAALGFAALMAVFGAAGETVERISNAGRFGVHRSALAKAVDWLTDPILAILVALASPEDTQWLRLFVPAILFGLLRLGERWGAPRWQNTYRDRVALALLIVPAAFLGVAQPVVAVIALVVLVSLFLAPSRGQ